MIPFEEMRRRLAVLGRDRKWLAAQTGYSESTVRQYLGPSGKRTEDFLKEASTAILAEEERQRAAKPERPQWNLIFLTEEEFDRADMASRIVHAESLKAFCRETILARADEILHRKKRGPYSNPTTIKGLKVAEEEG